MKKNACAAANVEFTAWFAFQRWHDTIGQRQEDFALKLTGGEQARASGSENAVYVLRDGKWTRYSLIELQRLRFERDLAEARLSPDPLREMKVALHEIRQARQPKQAKTVHGATAPIRKTWWSRLLSCFARGAKHG